MRHRNLSGLAVASQAASSYIAGMHDNDHSQCAHAHGHIKLTPSRQLVLDKLCAAARPVGAYEMIDILAAETGKRPAPVYVYRALDFLLENGLVHRLASRNAYMACAHQHGRSAPVAFLICEKCGRVTEATSPEVDEGLGRLAQESGFVAKAQVVEITGRCKDCAA
ncbi:MAG: Fe2+/Zn2+ uptake regulation protein-like protein [Hyphomicrobiales bacterium]|nr:Fe2+/Zn2+ uptake regulation protein-like protein [Hyphomicrobiales bacterium]